MKAPIQQSLNAECGTRGVSESPAIRIHTMAKRNIYQCYYQYYDQWDINVYVGIFRAALNGI